ncbi:MAG: hypothetical protein OHK006_03740 [Thermodesulfovibrionales bacterium]
MKTMRPLIIMCVLAALLLPACGDKKPSKTPAAPQQAAAPAPAAVPQKEEPKAEKEVYIYDAQGRRDPFLSLVDLMKKKPQRKKGQTPIENFDVEEIKLIAIAWDKQQYYAMITLPDNKSYSIRKGTTLGLNGGKVVDITRNSVLIREQLTDYKGQKKTKDTILKLRTEGEE